MTFKSSGAAEEEFLTKLVEAVTGISPDDKDQIDGLPKNDR
jgi:putative lipoic acid-binding regulatory protein